MKDPALEAFVVAIEQHLSARRGKQHALSPPDFALAREWHAAGVPLVAVLAVIEQAFEGGQAPSSLQPCRPLVASLPRAEAAPPVESSAAREPADLRERLAGLEAAVSNAGRPAAFEKAARKLRELIDLTSVAREPNWPYLRNKLEELDALVEEAALEALSAPETGALAADAAAALERQQGRVSGDALDAARSRYLRRRARERFALPRVSGD